MARDIKITRITTTHFNYEIADMELEEQLGFDTVYRKTITAGATDFVRANSSVDGGITGVMKIAAMAESHGLDVELHGGGLAHRHIMATLRNANYYELGLVHPLVNDTKPAFYSERRWLDELDSVDENGCVEVPEGPGLGVEVDWDWVEVHKTGETVYE